MRNYMIQLIVDANTRKRLQVVKQIIRMSRDDIREPTWTNCVEWLLHMVPTEALLADMCQPAVDTAPKEE